MNRVTHYDRFSSTLIRLACRYSVPLLPTWISELHLLFETLIFVFSLHFKKMCDEFYLFYTVLIWNLMIGKYSLQNESSFCSPLNSRSNTQSDCQVCILMKCKFDPLHLFKIKTNPLSLPEYVIVITFKYICIYSLALHLIYGWWKRCKHVTLLPKWHSIWREAQKMECEKTEWEAEWGI